MIFMALMIAEPSLLCLNSFRITAPQNFLLQNLTLLKNQRIGFTPDEVFEAVSRKERFSKSQH